LTYCLFFYLFAFFRYLCSFQGSLPIFSAWWR